MKKIKTLIPIILTSFTAPFISIVGCAKTELSKELLDQAVDEFIEVAKNPRRSGYHDKIVPYLTNRIKSLGYAPNIDEASNIWFDVPATSGYENYKKLILQAHTDMVIAGLTYEKSLVTPIEVEYHSGNNTLTSKEYKTSLGADDGIGVGTILALLNNKRVKHGPIRVIFTSDEETGMDGATKLSADVIDSDYLISLDAEMPFDGYYRSCQGTIQYDYSKTFATEEKTSTTIYSLELSGLSGGHSGNDINKGRANAIVFLFSILDDLDDSNLQIVEFNHINEKGELVDVASNAIPGYGTIKFITSKSEADIKQSINNVIKGYKSIYFGENWDNVKFTLTQKQDSCLALSHDDSNKLITLLCNVNGKGIKYGVHIFDSQNIRPLKSANISPLFIENGIVKFSCQSRAVKTEYLDLLKSENKKAWEDLFGQEGITIATNYNPWEANDDDKIIKMVVDGYRSINIDPYIRDTNGGVEPTIFKQKRSSINITCLGTKFENTHTVNETCYLTPLQNTIKVILYVLENMNKI